MFVALIEKSARSSVYGKSLSKVILTFVFNVGFADSGVNYIPALVFDIVVIDNVFVTV